MKGKKKPSARAVEVKNGAADGGDVAGITPYPKLVLGGLRTVATTR